jgi:3,4-dihydroxy 2-butanone 4-phosphate synthase/GTP cyclohydrolase II
LDTHLKISPTARLFENRKKPILACSDSAARSDRAQELLRAGAALLPIKSDRTGHLSLPELLRGLFERGIKSVMVEGGAQVIGAFLHQDLVDRVMLTITPVYIGGLKALENALSGLSEVREVSSFTAGRDIILLGEFQR